MFTKCDFLLGQNQSIVIVVPAHLPKAETYTVSVSDRDIRFKAGHEDICSMPYPGGEVFRRIAGNVQIGIVEHESPDDFPSGITNVAYVEVRRSA